MSQCFLLAGVVFGVLIAVVGVGLVYVPAAFVVFGGALAFVCERHLQAREVEVDES